MKLCTALTLLVLFAGCYEKAGQPAVETTGTAQSPQQTGTLTATTTGITGGTSSALLPDDKTFVENAGMISLAELTLGNLVLQKSAGADAKAFAQRMVTDHTKVKTELQELATAKGVALPTELDSDQKSAFRHLESLSGAELDKAYLQHMVADHRKAVADFEKAAASAQDVDLKTWAAKTLPTLRVHLQLAQRVSSRA